MLGGDEGTPPLVVFGGAIRDFGALIFCVTNHFAKHLPK